MVTVEVGSCSCLLMMSSSNFTGLDNCEDGGNAGEGCLTGITLDSTVSIEFAVSPLIS